MELSIFLTEQATKHFSKLTTNQKAISLKVKKSGCSGFSYVLDVIENPNQSMYHFEGVPFLIPKDDEKILNNLVIDLKQEGLNSRIVFDNPNTMNECGCGESFSLKEV